METRGVRNCNPLNIRHGASKWKGMNPVQTDREFVQFENMIWGIRAAIVTLKTYYYKHGCNTIKSIINRWAPTNENNTKEYIRFITKETNITNENNSLYWTKDILRNIVTAMAKYESGYNIKKSDFDIAWNLT